MSIDDIFIDDTPMPAHSIIGASSMYRWSACPGSVRLCRDIVDPPSKYAEEGTYAHEMAAHFVQGDLPAEEFHKLEPEMQAALTLYAAVIGDDYQNPNWPRERDTDNVLFIEKRLDMSSIYPGCFGTADAIIWQPAKRKLICHDFKYGAGVVVEPERNQQLMYYALGALRILGFDAKEVECGVIQPRAKHKKGPVRRWSCPSTEYIDFEADLIEAAKRTEDPEAPLNPGRHCYFCPARNTCPARHAQRLDQAKSEFERVADDDIFS